MSDGQKVVKYIGITLAGILILWIFAILLLILSIFTNDDSKQYDITFEDKQYTKLDIDLAVTNLIIKTGEKLSIKTNNRKINIDEDNGIITIKEEKSIINSLRNKTLTIYLPDTLQLNTVDIDNGIGKLELNSLTTKVLDLQLGIGKSIVKKINITSKIKIEGGVGSLQIEDSILNNLELDLGIGATNITAEILGTSEIKNGMGALNLTLVGKKEEYSISPEKGIGVIEIDNHNVISNDIIGKGNNDISIQGGIGKIIIDYKDKK